VLRRREISAYSCIADGCRGRGRSRSHMLTTIHYHTLPYTIIHPCSPMLNHAHHHLHSRIALTRASHSNTHRTSISSADGLRIRKGPRCVPRRCFSGCVSGPVLGHFFRACTGVHVVSLYPLTYMVVVALCRSQLARPPLRSPAPAHRSADMHTHVTMLSAPCAELNFSMPVPPFP
jgi:hypothetical protein